MEGCWIKPNGEIIEVPKFGHNDYASQLLIDEVGHDNLYYEDKHPYQILHDRGWVRVEISAYHPRVRVLGDCVDLTKPMRNTIDPSMNSIQMRIAKMICEEYSTDFHQSINDKRFW